MEIDFHQAIPEKPFYTIGEVAELCQIKAHVLRYWETEFPQLQPIKRRGNRRFYRHEDLILVQKLQDLLYAQGLTIKGARQKLAEAGESKITPSNEEYLGIISKAIKDLESILNELQ